MLDPPSALVELVVRQPNQGERVGDLGDVVEGTVEHGPVGPGHQLAAWPSHLDRLARRHGEGHPNPVQFDFVVARYQAPGRLTTTGKESLLGPRKVKAETRV